MKNGRNGSTLLARCAPHFRRLSKKLGARHRGEIVAVEPKTGTCFVGRDELEVALRARRAIQMRSGRVGFKGAEDEFEMRIL